MRDIAEIQNRISQAFTSLAPKDGSDDAAWNGVPRTPEQPVAANVQRHPGALRALFTKILKWRRPQAIAPDVSGSPQIANVVHELRTPLNGILGMTHLLGQTKLTAEQQNYLSGIRQSGYALAQLVEDLLDHSTMEAGRFRLNNRAADLRQLIEGVVEMLAPRAHGKRIEIAATLSAAVPELLDFDPARIRQVLFNVIGNAVKFTTTGGVLVRAFIENETVAISVADTGPGMTEEEQTRIFGAFEQAGSAETRSGGTGLGLGIASRILAEFGGSLSVSSRKGNGSVFTIRYPMRLAEDAPAGAAVRNRSLFGSRVLLLAPDGPAAFATVSSIETLGGRGRHVSDPAQVQLLIDRAKATGSPYTDLIVDHRLASDYAWEPSHAPLHRILLVNPEERASQPQEYFDAWLIRPLREKSLVDVLSGRMRGFGARDRPVMDVPAPENSNSVDRKREAGPALDILLGEDDPVSALLVAAVLRKAGHTVRSVEDFGSLIEALGENRPDVVLCDMHMPGGNIMDLISAASRTALQPVPVMVLTAESRGEARRKVIDQGACKVLQKPLDPAVLIEELRLFAQASSTS
ncbi:response regulator [Rhizobium sp. CFBP 8752]|uniref:hybrid sensor histidine kinase/response regulator n=1 Tax=Rhizobium sp. CFBP 8752 TaxID=2775301 RepID=UPI00177CE073|nr:ATP-binding protein [Rhizobium sp. CFBP 8752]MBD8664944.1 response regulator [Rhizobium sp. CFBP 8752]